MKNHTRLNRGIRPSLALALTALSAIFFGQTEVSAIIGDGGQWKVRQVNANANPASLADAELVLRGFGATGEVTTVSDVIDYGLVGNFNLDADFPGLRNGENAFAVEATGQIQVRTAGEITFGLFADNLARLEIDGNTVVESSANGVSSFGTVDLSLGTHDVRVLYFEGTGSSDLEVFVAAGLGTFTDFAETDFELLRVVSDPSPTDIAISSAVFPSNAVAGAVVGELSGTSPSGGEHDFQVVYPIDPASPIILLSEGSGSWRYLDDGTLPAGAWTSVGYDDSLWTPGGVAPLGYSDAAIVTDIADGVTVAYFRKTFAVPIGELERVDSVTLRVLRDDGVAIYINGAEVVRDSLPDGPLDNNTLATVTTGGQAEGTYFEYTIDRRALVEGVNTLAVELHQASLTSSDLIFDIGIEYQRRADIGIDAQYFEIDGNQLVLRRDAAAIPAGVGATFDIAVRATNECGASYEEGLVISTGFPSSDAPTAVTLDNTTINETSPAGSLVGLLDATDANAGDNHSFALVGALFADNAAFTISGNRLRTAAAFDAGAKNSYSINVEATDPTGLSVQQVFVIDVEPAPARILVSPEFVPENAPEFTAVGELSTVDPLTANHSYRLLVDVDPLPVQLISFGDIWRFLDDGSIEGTEWRGLGFDDAAWAQGAAPLGYGTLDTATAATTVGFGPDGQNKYAATYFRRAFQIVDPGTVVELLFDLALDDGGIVYINGQEVLRVRAAAVASPADYTGEGDGGETTNDLFTLSSGLPQLLVAGTNTIAVEVHQTNATSSDLWLDLDLQAVVSAGGSDSDHFYLIGNQIFTNKEIAEIPAEDGDSLTLQIESTSDLGEVVVEDVILKVGPASSNPPTDIALDNTAIDEGLPAGSLVGNLSSVDIDGGAFSYSVGSNPLFPANELFTASGGQLFTAVPIDFDDGSPLTILITTTDNTGLSFSEQFDITINQVLEPPTGVTLTPSTFAFDDPAGTVIGTLAAVDSNELETHTFTFGTWPDVPGTPIIAFGSVWKYLDDGSDQGTAWFAPGYDDSLWASGPGQLGYGDGDEATVVGFIDTDPVTAGDQKNATTYFRHKVDVPVPNPGGYQIQVAVDDAVAIHINGDAYEIRQTNLSAFPAPVAFDEFATATSPDGTILTVEVPAGVIVAGENTIAVEIHQASATSSDISFDLQLAPIVASPYPAYFTINGDQLETTVDFATTGIVPPFTFDIPIVAEDSSGQTVEVFVQVDMTGGASDTDADGLLDSWEIANFGDLGFGPNDDPDNDGHDNADEYGADTDPNDPADFFQISRITRGNNMIVFWPAVPDRTYSVFGSPDLTEGSWVLLQGGLTTAVAAELSYDDGPPSPGEMFYRVEAEAPPLP